MARATDGDGTVATVARGAAEPPAPRPVRLAAVGDLHYGRTAPAALQGLFAQMAAAADVVALCGDLTDRGLPEEARLLARDLATQIKVPIVAVLGNHDHEVGKADEVRQALVDVGVTILDGESIEILGIGFAGVKGFGGGFGEHALQAWGEELIKRFVHEAIDEALKLESAVARLRTESRIALLHYAPVEETVRGEALEIYPFLGSSRLEEPLTRHPLTAVFHGHAHHGQPRGQTRTGTPVYNVAAPLLGQVAPDRPAFHLLELAAAAAAPEPARAPAIIQKEAHR